MLPPEDIDISAIVDTKSINGAANSASNVYKFPQKGSTLCTMRLAKKRKPSKESIFLEVTAR